MPNLHTFIGEPERKIEQDVLHWLGNREYCLKQATVKNTSGASITVTDPIGYPLKVVSGEYEPALAGDEANAVAIIAGGTQAKYLTLADDGTIQLLVLVRGPAIIKYDGIPAKDYAAAAFDKADIETALAALDMPILTVKSGTNATVTEGM